MYLPPKKARKGCGSYTRRVWLIHEKGGLIHEKGVAHTREGCGSYTRRVWLIHEKGVAHTREALRLCCMTEFFIAKLLLFKSFFFKIDEK